MSENLNLAKLLNRYVNGEWKPVRYIIDESKIDNFIIKRTNGIEVNIKDYIKLIALEVLEEILTKAEDDKDEGELQNLS